MKEFTDADIDAMVAEVQDLIKSTQEDLIKSAGKKMAAAKEGGNGTTPVVAGKGLGKDEAPMAKEASDEASPAPEKSAGPAPESSGGDSAPSDSGSDSAPAPKPDAAPDAGGDPSQAAGADEPSLEQQYGQLSDEELQMHLQALKAVVMQRMGGGGDPSASAGGPPADPMAGSAGPSASPSAPPAPVAPPSPSASASPMASAGPGPMAPPAPEAAPQEKSMMMPPAMKSEKEGGEALKKAEAEIAELKGTLNGVVGILETILNKPERKAITSMAQYVAKSEADRPVAKKLTRPEVMEKLNKITRDPSLKKSERDSIDRYVYGDEKALVDIEHLLK